MRIEKELSEKQAVTLMHSIFIQTYIKYYLIIITYFYTKVNGFGIKSLTSRVKSI